MRLLAPRTVHLIFIRIRIRTGKFCMLSSVLSVLATRTATSLAKNRESVRRKRKFLRGLKRKRPRFNFNAGSYWNIFVNLASDRHMLVLFETDDQRHRRLHNTKPARTPWSPVTGNPSEVYVPCQDPWYQRCSQLASTVLVPRQSFSLRPHSARGRRLLSEHPNLPGRRPSHARPFHGSL